MARLKKDHINPTFYDELYYIASIFSSNYSPEYMAISVLSVFETLGLITLNNLILLMIKIMDKHYFETFWHDHKTEMGLGIFALFILLVVINMTIFFERGVRVIEHFSTHSLSSKLPAILVIMTLVLFLLSTGFLTR